ncbi:MAG: EF-hand domain-containing protein [Planctomycetaceae bacterium]|nr:EF-hand domain-containing protein [Planctomycetaceae bacterium]
MRICLIALSGFLLFTSRGQCQSPESLFQALDRNQDGVVSVDEVSDDRLTFFRRALRVADRNEDGALSEEELREAISTPQPVTVSTAINGGRAGAFDPAALDRNRDGKIAKDEVPAQLMDRFQPLFAASGGNEIPVDGLRQLMGQRPENKSTGNKSTEVTMKEKDEKTVTRPEEMSAAPNADRLREMLRRLDRNGDGELNTEELKRAPESVRALDRNQDGRLNRNELTPDRGRDSTKEDSSAESSDFFRRLDTDKNGRLTQNELPPRMRQNFSNLDTNGNRSISESEFEAAVRRFRSQQ